MEEVVHITPLGFEIDRVIKPLEKYPANRIHILTVDNEKHGYKLYKKQKKYTEKVKKHLKQLDIDYRIHDTDIFSLLEVMEKTSEIIKKEKNNKSNIYINISGAGRLTAVATTLTGMYHDIQTYYVKADRYPENTEEKNKHGLSIVENPETKKIINFKFKKPSPEAVTVLKLIDKNGPQKTDEILNHLSKNYKEYRYEGRYQDLDRKKKQKLIMRLNRRIIDKLEENGYIERQKKGRRNIIKNTDSGTYMAKIN